MKKVIAALISSFICITTLCGCSINEKPISMEKSMDIPENGIISEYIFKELKDENKVITFKGKCDKTEYEWTVFGNSITEPKDTNLKIEVLKDSKNRMTFKLCSKEDFNFSATLAIQSSKKWDTDSAQLFFENQEDKDAVTTVSITGKEKSVLNMSIQKKGTYIIKPLEKQLEEQITKNESENATENDTKTNRAISDGSQKGQDAYLTDPVPQGKPLPVEPGSQSVNPASHYYCTISIECSTILNNLGDLESSKLGCVPAGGVILYPQTVEFYEGESVFDVLQRICNSYGIHMEASWTPMYNSAYVEGINNLYEFDCGSGSGWMYRVNGWYPNYGCSRYQLADGDYIEWRYTCDLGADIGGGYAIGG